MALLKIVGSFYNAAAGYLDIYWGIRYRINGAWTMLGQEDRFYNGTVITQYQTVPETCHVQVFACGQGGGMGLLHYVVTVEVIGLMTYSWYQDHIPYFYTCIAGMPYWSPTEGSVDPSWAWSTLTHGESIVLAGATSPDLQEGGYSIMGYYLRRVRSRWDVILSSDHNIPRTILGLCRDRVKEAEP